MNTSIWKANNKGFTLIELVVTLSVLTILVTIAIPSYRNTILNNRLTTGADSLVNAMNYARGVALSNNVNVRICPFNAPNSIICGTNWADGWIVVTQPVAGASTLIKSQQNGDITPKITANNASITFNSRGLASSQTNFTFCDTRGAHFARSIEVMTTGYIQSGSIAGQAVWNNGALACP